MTSPARIAANRRNALKSTGPRSISGKAIVATNAIVTGLHSRQLVLAMLGETTESLTNFRTAVAASLDADGPLEGELADQIALLLWRRRRVVVAEAAAYGNTRADLPPDPETITGDDADTAKSLPADAPPAARLARMRALLRHHHLDRERVRQAALVVTIAAVNAAAEIDWMSAQDLLRQAAAVLGWCPQESRERWAALLRDLGLDPGNVDWTVARLHAVIEAAAVREQRHPGEIFDAIRTRMLARAEELSDQIAAREHDERQLVDAMCEQRTRTAAVLLVSDERLIQSIAKLEGHLGRELQRNLGLLQQLQAARRDGPLPQAALGFVFPPTPIDDDPTTRLCTLD